MNLKEKKIKIRTSKGTKQEIANAKKGSWQGRQTIIKTRPDKTGKSITMAKNSTEVATKVRGNDYLQNVDFSSSEGLSQALQGLDNVHEGDFAEITSDYLNPEVGVEYNCLVTGMGEMNDSINDPDATKGLKIACIEGSYLKDGVLTRFVNADVICVSTFKRIFATGVKTVLCKIVNKGLIGETGKKYKDLSIRVVTSNA